jgi:hypothetical protein
MILHVFNNREQIQNKDKMIDIMMIFLLLGWFCKIFSVDNFQISYFKIFHKLYETKMWQAECLY